MSTDRPPTIDPAAAVRWSRLAPRESPWLHEEVGRRMEGRLQWIKLVPDAWADWEPTRGGMGVHHQVAARYARATCYVVEPTPERVRCAQDALRKPWWDQARWTAPAPRFEAPPDAAVQMLWANMALHMAGDPQQDIVRWHRALAPDGFLMFSCLGPDTLRELRDLYQTRGWLPPAHEFTDMHDWGDMLVHAGFAEPVMDMERITLTFETAPRLLEELRGLGRNLHSGRFGALRGRGWHQQLLQALPTLAGRAAQPGPLPLTFEIIYGHAFKAPPRLPVQGEAVMSLDDMRQALRRGRSLRAARA